MVAESEANNNEFWSGSLPYFIFSAFIIGIIIFTAKYIPETKGKTLEELEELWDIPEEAKASVKIECRCRLFKVSLPTPSKR